MTSLNPHLNFNGDGEAAFRMGRQNDARVAGLAGSDADGRMVNCSRPAAA